MLRRWLSVAVLPALAAATAGCTRSEAAEAPELMGALAVVVGAHANAPAPQLSGVASHAADMALAQRSLVSLIVADGAPYQAAQWGGAGGEGDGSPSRRQLDEAIAAAGPKTEDTDLVTALQLAGRSIADQPGPHTVLVLDSGLSTRGPLDFTTPGLLNADPQQVANILGDNSQSPALAGAQVVFQGLGETAAPQQTLPPAAAAHLAAIWTTVATRAGAGNVEVVPSRGEPPPAAASSGALTVRTVDVPPDMSCDGTDVVLSGGRFDYHPDSALFTDIPAAVDGLRPLAQQLIDRQITAIIFGGSSSEGTPAGRKTLSGERAQSVANILIKLGVPVSQLHVEGLGSDFAGFAPDRDSQGVLLPAAAALNVRVMMELTGPVTCG